MQNISGLIRLVNIGYTLILVGVPIIALIAGRKPRPDEPVPSADEFARYVVWSCLYCNPNDPRGIVPKGDSNNGFTINMRYRALATAWLSFVIAGGAAVFLFSIFAVVLRVHPK